MRGRVLLSLVAVAGSWCIPGCEDEGGPELANQSPVVSLQSGPVEGDTVSHHVTLSWSGSDPDGRVARYEVALDPPIEFSEEEITSGGPGIVFWLVPGVGDASDTTRISKQVDDRSVHFDWVHTAATEQAFRFSAEEAESVEVAGLRRPSGRFLGMHAVYVRAVDDDDDPSTPDRVAFTASTVAPSAEVVSTRIQTDVETSSAAVTIRWTGLDPDGPDGDLRPAGYYYKLLNLTALGINCVADLSALLLYLFTNQDDPGWVYQDAGKTEGTFHLPSHQCFLFGIRAVDAAGAVEPFLELHRNVVKFRTAPNEGFPVITITEASLGTFEVSYPFQPLTQTGRELQAAVGRPIRFFWSASGENYGGEIEGCSWGVDIPDLDVEGPGSGWSPWSPVVSTPPITYNSPGIHTFYIRCRDTSGTINIAEIVVRFVSFPLDREVLYVDDFPDEIFPRPEHHDAFWFSLFDPANSEGRLQEGDVSQWDVFGPNDTGQAPLVPDLERMGRYKLIVWSCNGGGYNGASALLDVASKTPLLAAYLRAGGKLWLSGVYTVAATTQPLRSGIADFTYPKMPGAGEFAWDILRIQSDRIDNDKGETNDHRFVRAIPADSMLTGEPHYYNAMHVDHSKFHPRSSLKSVAYVDAIIDPLFAEANDNCTDCDLDSLYVYGTVARTAGRPSDFDYRVCALRWHDPDPAREHGRVQWFGFPMYYFKNTDAQDTFNRSIDWFREE